MSTIDQASGKVHQPKTDVITTEPHRLQLKAVLSSC